MNYEVEQKYPVADLQQLKLELAKMNATPEPAIEQVDQYFAHPAKDFSQTDEALRIRRVGEQNYLTYKGPKLDTTTKTRREIEVPLESGELGFDRFAELLESLGFRTVAQVRKARQPFKLRWQDRAINVDLDEVVGVGSFVELELIVADDEVEAAKACIATLAAHLQLAQNERRSYLELLLETVRDVTHRAIKLQFKSDLSC